MLDFTTRLRVLLGAAITYITAAVLGITVAADAIAKAGPEGSEGVVAWLIRIATWLTAVVTMVRSHSPVPVGQRGLLPLKKTISSRTHRS